MNRTFDTNPTRLLERVYGQLIIDLVKESNSISKRAYGNLAEPDKGLYFKGFLKPYITDRDHVYDVDVRESLDPIHYFTDQVFTDPVRLGFTRDGRVISKQDSVDLARLLQGHPEIPVSECELVLLAVCDYLTDHTAAVSGTDVCKSYDELFMVDYTHMRGIRDLPPAISYDLTPSIPHKLDRFIGDDEWSMYSLYLTTSTVVIHKHMDWRAWMYHKEMWEQQMKDNERLTEWQVAGYEGDFTSW